MRVETATIIGSIRSIRGVAALALSLPFFCADLLGCESSGCPAGTVHDGAYCRQARNEAGSGGMRSGPLANPIIVSPPAMSSGSPALGAAGGGGNVVNMQSVAGSAASSPMQKLCPMDACMPGGNCVEAATDYSCNCGTGYIGTHTKQCMIAYTVGAQGVTDNMTHLVWQPNSSANSFTQRDAATFCATLSASSGWRLPSKDELLTLVDRSVPPPAALIDATAFPNTPATGFWTSSPASTSGTFWSVDFSRGDASMTMASVQYRVRCVL
jgi:Protein of unknown function (DUF1566)